MNPYSTHDADGRFRWVSEQFEPPLEVPAGHGFVEGRFGDEYYFDGAGAVLRPAMPTSIDTLTVVGNGVDVATISGVPNPTDVTIAGAASTSFESTGGTEELTFDTPGAYRVTLRSFPYLDQEYTINAT